MCSLIIVFSLFLCILPGVQADTISSPHDDVEVSADGKYIFVMLVTDTDAIQEYGADAVMVPAIREKYAVSGLYKNDGSTTPLWTVNWEFPYTVDISSDGEHVLQWVLAGQRDEFDTLALAFLKNGKEVTRYNVDQLVRNPETLPTSISYYRWRKLSSLDDSKGQLHVETENGERYVFDIRTGKVIAGEQPLKGTQVISGAPQRERRPNPQFSVPVGAIVVGISSVASILLLITLRSRIGRSKD